MGGIGEFMLTLILSCGIVAALVASLTTWALGIGLALLVVAFASLVLTSAASRHDHSGDGTLGLSFLVVIPSFTAAIVFLIAALARFLVLRFMV